VRMEYMVYICISSLRKRNRNYGSNKRRSITVRVNNVKRYIKKVKVHLGNKTYQSAELVILLNGGIIVMQELKPMH